MIRALALLLLLAAPAFARCGNTLEPPAQDRGIPSAVPVYRLIPRADMTERCIRDLNVSASRSTYILACNGWKGGKWLVYLRSDVSLEQQYCDAQHEFGHENERERTGDPNAGHRGWDWGL